MFAGCGHVSGLLMRLILPLVIDEVRTLGPNQNSELASPDSASGGLVRINLFEVDRATL